MVPECTELFDDFYTTQHVAVADAEHGCTIRRVRVPLARTDTDMDLGVPVTRSFAGLLPLIKQRLDELGLRVLEASKPAPPLSSPSHLVTLATDGYDCDVDDAMLDLVQRRDMGVVRYNANHIDPARLVAEIALAWPKMRIVVAVTRREDAWGIRKRLCGQYGLARWDVTAFAGGGTLERPGRIRIATYANAADAGVGGWTPSIFLSLNPTEMLGNYWAEWGMEIMQHTRMYAVLPAEKQVTASQQDQISARFGFIEVTIPQHGVVERPVYSISGRIAIDGNLLRNSWTLLT